MLRVENLSKAFGGVQANTMRKSIASSVDSNGSRPSADRSVRAKSRLGASPPPGFSPA